MSILLDGTLGTTTPAETIATNLTFTGTGNRITGDFSNATVANSVAFQSSTTNGFTILNTLPNGTSSISGARFFSGTDPDNSSLCQIIANGTTSTIFATKTGTGTYGPLTFNTSATERMRIDSSGNVGIGTASPTAKFHVYAAASTDAKTIVGALTATNSAYTAFVNTTVTTVGTENSTGGNLVIGSSAYSTVLANNGAYPISFGTNNTERMRIDSSGNVGIGTASPAAALDVFGRGRIETNADVNPVLRVGATNGGSATIGCYSGYFSGNPNNTTASFFQGFSSTTTNRISIWSNGNIQNSNNSYGALSDEKLKENIVDATPKLSDLMQVRIRNYNLKYDPEHKQIGVIAQELEQVFPGMIDETSDLDEEGNDLGTKTKAVKYSVFVPMLIKAIQELKAIVDAQAVRIAALES